MAGTDPSRTIRSRPAGVLRTSTLAVSLSTRKVCGTPAGVPVEVQSDVFNAIRLATAKGIVVVEAAGNGSSDLDNFTVKGKKILNRTSPDFQGDSLAIMVGACNSKIPHGAHPVSNVGSRVDCNAWGDHMVVPGNVLDPDKMDDPFQYHLTPSPDVGDVPFGHTSGATAIIAAVSLLVQHLRGLLTPADGTSGRLTRRDAHPIKQRQQRDPAHGRQDRANAEPVDDRQQRVRLSVGEFGEQNTLSDGLLVISSKAAGRPPPARCSSFRTTFRVRPSLVQQ